MHKNRLKIANGLHFFSQTVLEKEDDIVTHGEKSAGEKKRLKTTSLGIAEVITDLL